jgi:hypothetical protein
MFVGDRKQINEASFRNTDSAGIVREVGFSDTALARELTILAI